MSRAAWSSPRPHLPNRFFCSLKTNFFINSKMNSHSFLRHSITHTHTRAARVRQVAMWLSRNPAKDGHRSINHTSEPTLIGCIQCCSTCVCVCVCYHAPVDRPDLYWGHRGICGSGGKRMKPCMKSGLKQNHVFGCLTCCACVDAPGHVSSRCFEGPGCRLRPVWASRAAVSVC